MAEPPRRSSMPTPTAWWPPPTATTATPPSTPARCDRPGNRIDEDCSGADAAFALIPARLSFEWLGRGDGTTRAATLLVTDVPKGGKVELRCKGPGCAARTRTAKVARGKANLVRLVSRRLRAKAVVEIRVTAPDFIGKSIRFTMRGKGRQPKKTTARADDADARAHRPPEHSARRPEVGGRWRSGGGRAAVTASGNTRHGDRRPGTRGVEAWRSGGGRAAVTASGNTRHGDRGRRALAAAAPVARPAAP